MAGTGGARPGSGKKRLPTAIHKLNGNPSHVDLEARERTEPKYKPLRAEPPDHLTDDAKAEWHRVLPILERAGVLTEADAPALEAYCMAYGNWKEACLMVQRFGTLTVGKNGTPEPSPWQKIQIQNYDKMLKIMVEFGMTPASRSRVSVEAKNDDNTSKMASLLSM